MNVCVDVEIVRLEPTPALVLGRNVSREMMDDVIIDGIRRVRSTVTAARVPTAGPPFVRYLSTRSPFHVEIGLPLHGPHSVPTLRATILPGGKAASLWHTGTHVDSPDSLAELEQWVDANAVATGDPWQWYWTEPDASRPRLQFVWPVSDT